MSQRPDEQPSGTNSDAQVESGWSYDIPIYDIRKNETTPPVLSRRCVLSSIVQVIESLLNPPIGICGQICILRSRSEYGEIDSALLKAEFPPNKQNISEKLFEELGFGRSGLTAATIFRPRIFGKTIQTMPVFPAGQTYKPSFNREIQVFRDYERYLTILFENGSLEAVSATAVPLVALLPLIISTIRVMYNLCEQLQSDYKRLLRGLESSVSFVRKQRLELRRVIEECDDEWTRLNRCIRSQELLNPQPGTQILQTSIGITLVEAFRDAMDKSRRLETEIRDYMQLRAGELALEESKKSIELSNIQIQEGKRVKIFTILAFVYVPLNLTTSIFGMNIQQLNASGQDLYVFLTTAVVALVVTGGAWVSIELYGSSRAWRHRFAQEDSDNRYDGKPEYSIGLRVIMLCWLLLNHGRWTWKSGAWLSVLTNSYYGKFDPILGKEPKESEGTMRWAGHYVWYHSQHQYSNPQPFGAKDNIE